MPGKKTLKRLRRHKRRRQRIIRGTVQFFVWTGVAVIYYTGFSLFFDTPLEYMLKHSTDGLRDEYKTLTARYDSLTMVLDNLSERDRNVFRILFESDPYESEAEIRSRENASYEALVEHPTRQLKRDLRQSTEELERRLEELNPHLPRLAGADRFDRDGEPQHTGHPTRHQQTAYPADSLLRHAFPPVLQDAPVAPGVDYTIPEGSRVFATADGTVTSVAMRNSTSGQTVTIDHGNGYETLYGHLSRILVQKGQRVRRGDIIALSGDTGLSLAPHLHYEIRLDGMRVDPIHYFFMELSPSEYQRIMRIAQTGMQSFD